MESESNFDHSNPTLDEMRETNKWLKEIARGIMDANIMTAKKMGGYSDTARHNFGHITLEYLEARKERLFAEPKSKKGKSRSSG
jgi:hypothetical protein